MPRPSGSAMPCGRNFPALGSTRRSRCIQFSPWAAEHQCGNILAPPARMIAGISRSMRPGRATACSPTLDMRVLSAAAPVTPTACAWSSPQRQLEADSRRDCPRTGEPRPSYLAPPSTPSARMKPCARWPCIDADVHIGGSKHPLPLRLVEVHTPKGYCFFPTNLPPRIGPRQVADLYRVRWEVELSIRLDKSVHRLDTVDSERPCSLKTLLQASLIASTIAALLAHTHNLQTRPPQADAPRTEAPLHPRRLALQRAVSCQSIAQAFDLQGAEAMQRWDRIAALLTHSGTDPNWRRRPSVFDQLRGWKRQSVVRKQTKRPNLKAVA